MCMVKSESLKVMRVNQNQKQSYCRQPNRRNDLIDTCELSYHKRAVLVACLTQYFYLLWSVFGVFEKCEYLFHHMLCRYIMLVRMEPIFPLSPYKLSSSPSLTY